ncbi:hypothetical protein GGR56DRAFT_698136 [Xylariaceae sp. FL0804]|nr:hypothetical protein GGR56DRAFT_698136 [Xylariaceae sp. FL0804]
MPVFLIANMRQSINPHNIMAHRTHHTHHKLASRAAPTTTTTTTTTTTRRTAAAPVHHQKRHAGIGDKIKGALMKLEGAVTRRPGKKAAGTRRMHGTDGRGSHRRSARIAARRAY